MSTQAQPLAVAPDTLEEKPNSIYLVLGVFAAVIATLFCIIKYASGYGDARVTILHFANTIWGGGEDWQHCYLVPIAVAGVIYYERKKLLALPVRVSWAGLAMTLLGLFVYAVGYRADNVYLGYASFQILTGGMILWLLGWRWAIGLLFPWVFLVFIYPLPFLDNFIAFPLRLILSEASVQVLNTIGLSAMKSGSAIISASDPITGIKAGTRFSVDVADACSGIRSLFALMMVSALYSYLTQPGWWRKIVLFLCSIPLAIVGNLARILILTFGTIAIGAETAIGTHDDPSSFHTGAGFAIFAVALGGLLGIGRLLNLDWKTKIAKARSSFKEPPPPPPGAIPAPPRAAYQDEY